MNQNWRDVLPKKENLIDKDKKQRFQLVLVSFIFFIVGLVFTVLNFTQDEMTLGYFTLSFSAVSLITSALTIFFKKGLFYYQCLFVVAVLTLFTSFIVTGGTKNDEGFSTYWLLILPFTAMLVLGIVKGSVATGTMFIICIVCLWTPISGNLLWNPSDTFRLRFPFIYLAAFAVSFLFELSRHFTSIAYEEARIRLKNASETDYLTGLHNRLWLANYLDSKQSVIGKTTVNVYCCIIDIDNFKSANDKYGHVFGDQVLLSITDILKKYQPESSIRFGGDEFMIVGENTGEPVLRELCENIRKDAEAVRFENHPDYTYTVSIGIAITNVDTDFRLTNLIELADAQSARAKTHGKNCVYLVNYVPENRTFKD